MLTDVDGGQTLSAGQPDHKGADICAVEEMLAFRML